MKSIKWVLFLIVGIGVVGVGFFLMSQRKTQPLTDVKKQLPRSASEGEVVKAQRIRDLLESERSLRCEFSYEDDQMRQKGVVYAASGKVKGEFEVYPKDADMFASYMMTDGEWLYTWGDYGGEMRGFKMKLEQQEKIKDEGQDLQPGSQSIVDVDKQMQFDCKEWREDPQVFEIPQDVEFIDMTKFQQEQKEIIDKNKCDFCQQIPDDAAKQECLRSLGC